MANHGLLNDGDHQRLAGIVRRQTIHTSTFIGQILWEILFSFYGIQEQETHLTPHRTDRTLEDWQHVEQTP